MAESIRFVRFVASPRALANGIVGDMVEWRVMGARMLERAKAHCPVGKDQSTARPKAHGGRHLRDTLIVRFIGGPDPRIMIGSTEKGDVLHFLVDGTETHFVAPKVASALSWMDHGQRFFSKGHTVRGIKANNFPLRAMREVVMETGHFG